MNLMHGRWKSVYLITCDPIGSTENRLIVQRRISECTKPINNEIIKAILKNQMHNYNCNIFSSWTYI